MKKKNKYEINLEADIFSIYYASLPAGTCPIRLAVFCCITAPEVDNVNTARPTDFGAGCNWIKNACNMFLDNIFWGLPSLCARAVVSVRILGRFHTESVDRNGGKSGPPVARYITLT